MIDATLLVKNLGSEEWIDTTPRVFAVLPRVGEYMELQQLC